MATRTRLRWQLMGLFMGYHSEVVICCFLVVLKRSSTAILLAFQLVKTISCKNCLDKGRMTDLHENDTAGDLRSVGYKTERWNGELWQAVASAAT